MVLAWESSVIVLYWYYTTLAGILELFFGFVVVPVDDSGDEAGDSKHRADGDDDGDVVAGAYERGERESVVEKESVFVGIRSI